MVEQKIFGLFRVKLRFYTLFSYAERSRKKMRQKQLRYLTKPQLKKAQRLKIEEVVELEKESIQKEELLEKLTEIYDQLEELEKTLDTNLAENRKKAINDQFTRLMSLESRITRLENACNSGPLKLIEKKRKGEAVQGQHMKLELGY